MAKKLKARWPPIPSIKVPKDSIKIAKPSIKR